MVDVTTFKNPPFMGILRGVEPDLIEPLMEAVVSSGLRVIEVAMNAPHAAEALDRACRVGAGTVTVGAGTVVSLDLLKGAMDQGAKFIVMPVLVHDVVERCAKDRIPVFPGALTPKEIHDAWAAGATMVKVFPAGALGPSYLREVKGPFQDIELLACGGVTPENAASYFSNGASAVAFGASVFRKEWLFSRDFASIGKRIGQYLGAGRAEA